MARYIGDKEVAGFLIKEEGFLDKPTDIGDGKITLGSGLTDPKWHALYKKKGRWSKEDNRNAVLEEVAKRRVWAEDTIPNWEQLPESAQDALLSYKYNYNFTPTNSPNLFEAMRKGNFFKAAEEINATSKDPKFRKGLEERRKREQEMFLSDLMPQKTSSHSVYVPYTNNTVSDNTRVTRYPTREESSQFRTIVPERNYVETTTISPGEQRAQQLRNTFESTRDYNRMMQNISIQNNPQPTFTPQYNYHSDGGSLNSKTWDNLSMAEKSEMMRVAIENGITTLPEIREAYNEFAKGGYAPSRAIKDRITAYEGKAMTGAKDPVTGKWGKNSSFESEAARFYNVLPENIRNQVLSNPELADNLYSYSYNVGAGNFKKRVVPALERYYAGEGSIKDIENSMWASNDAKLRGLQRRRAEEKEGVRNALLGEVIPSLHTEQELPAFIPSNPQAFFTPIESYQSPVVIEEPLVQAAMENPYSPEQLEREERAQGLRNLGLAMSIMRGGQEQSYSPLWSTVSMLSGNQMAKGGKIHIKPSHRGRLTELKKSTGKTEAELYKNGSAATRKMITFARNARKWKHGLGGNLFSGEDTPIQQMNTYNGWVRDANNHPIAFNDEGKYYDQITGETGELQLPNVNIYPSNYHSNFDSSLGLSRLSSNIGQFFRDRMYATVPPTGYRLSRIRNFIQGNRARDYQDANTEAMYGLYTGQDSIIGDVSDFYKYKKLPFPNRKLSDTEINTVEGRVVGHDYWDNQLREHLRKIAVKDLVKPSSVEKGAYEFMFPNISNIPSRDIKERTFNHNHSLGTYTLIPGEDSNGKFVDYVDTWDINPFKGVSANDDSFFAVGAKYGLDKFENIVPWGIPIKVHGRQYINNKEQE